VSTRPTVAGSSLNSRTSLLIILCAAACISLVLAGRADASSPLAKEAAASRSLALATTAQVRVHKALASHAHALKSCRREHRAKDCSLQNRRVRRDAQKLKSVRRKITKLKRRLSAQGSGSSGTNTPVGSKTGHGSTSAVGSTGHAPAATGPSSSAPSIALEGGSFAMGVVAGSGLSYELPFIQKLGAHAARIEFSIDTPTSQMAPIIESYAKAGIQPLLLAGFSGRIPSPAEAQKLGSWASEFGPEGSLWRGKSYPAGTAVTDIEFGNETSYAYQFSDNSTAGYASRAQAYALRFQEAATAIQAADSSVGLLAQGDSGGNGPEWVNQMFKAVPNLGRYVAGWTIHPYGPEWQSRIDNLISTTKANGAPSLPVYVTEWGLDSDNGRCLEYNFGWNKCMTYAEAANVLSATVSSMRARYGSRLGAMYLFQANDQQPAGQATNLESHFGALQNNGEAKGAYTNIVESLLSSSL
jgi:hypothetical protein